MMNANAKAVWMGLALAVLSGTSARGITAEDERIKLDCGVNALYVLLHLEEKPVSIDRLVSALPPPNPEGYSMAELAATGAALGPPLDGVRFASGDPRPDKPMIVFLKDSRGGHFAVLRPVGTTGTMVQVIDPPYPSWITDFDRLFKAEAWTDRVLLPRAAWFSSPGSMVRVILAAAAVLTASLWAWGRFLHRPPQSAETADAPTAPA